MLGPPHSYELFLTATAVPSYWLLLCYSFDLLSLTNLGFKILLVDGSAKIPRIQSREHLDTMAKQLKTFVVEHLDEELGPWSELEYLTIAKESHEAGSKFCLSSLPSSLDLPISLKSAPGFTAEQRSVEVLFADSKSRVCLLDPSATKELAPDDGEKFDVFLFGGILGEFP